MEIDIVTKTTEFSLHIESFVNTLPTTAIENTTVPITPRAMAILFSCILMAHQLFYHFRSLYNANNGLHVTIRLLAS